MSNPHRSPAAHESPLAVPVQITSASLHQFFDMSPDALVIVNQAGMIVMVNKQAEILLGYSHEETVGQQLEILLPQRFRQAHIDHRKHYFAAPITRQMGAGLQLSGRRRDGTEFPVDISLRPLLLCTNYCDYPDEEERCDDGFSYPGHLEQTGAVGGPACFAGTSQAGKSNHRSR